jgi:initiation factor 1A
MGKRKIVSEPDELDQMVEPGPGDVYGVVSKMYGYDRLLVDCADGKQRICRIRGQLKRRIWIKEGGFGPCFPVGFPARYPRRCLVAVYTQPGS